MTVELNTNGHSLSSTPFEGSDKDGAPMEDSSSAEGEESSESKKDGSTTSSIDSGDGRQLVDNELADEMYEFGYTGLVQVVEEEVSGDENAFGQG